MVDRNRTPAQPDPAKHQRDSGIRVFGAGIVILGIIIAISGVLAMIAAVSDHTQPNPLVRGAVTPHEEREIVAVQWVLFGIFALTAGRYVFLAAGKRGWLDRSGRALIILGYGLVLFGSLSSQPEYEARSALIFADTLGQSSRITL